MTISAANYVKFGHYCRSQGVFRRIVARLVRIAKVGNGPENKKIGLTALYEDQPFQFLSAQNSQEFPGLPPPKNGDLEPFVLRSSVVSFTSILFAKPEPVVFPFL